MKIFLSLLIPLSIMTTYGNTSNQPLESTSDLLNTITQHLDGEFDNFQQAWQENTEEDMHRVDIEEKHQHIHSVFKKISAVGQGVYFKVTHYKGRDSTNILEQHIFHFISNENGVYSDHYALPSNEDLSSLGKPLEQLTWSNKGNEILGMTADGNPGFVLKDNLLMVRHKSGIFSNKVSAFNMIKCRFFSGWIEYVLPEDPDSTYRMGNLVLHDQGGIVQLTFDDGTKGEYTVELTQLIFAKTLSIMKLAIYQEPLESIDYNSHSISYTWSDPASKRLGINLRKVLTGWTFIEPGYFSSNHFEENKEK